MNKILFQTTARLLAPLQLFLSLVLLLRGHNEPGGGFIGGLVAASAVLLYCLAFGFSNVRRYIPISWQALAKAGLVISLLSGLAGVVLDKPFMTALWGHELTVPIVGTLKFGSVLFFDVGVYIFVAAFGVGLAYCFSETEEP